MESIRGLDPSGAAGRSVGAVSGRDRPSARARAAARPPSRSRRRARPRGAAPRPRGVRAALRPPRPPRARARRTTAGPRASRLDVLGLLELALALGGAGARLDARGSPCARRPGAGASEQRGDEHGEHDEHDHDDEQRCPCPACYPRSFAAHAPGSRPDMSGLPDIDTALAWRGRTVRDAHGEELGKIRRLYLDSSDDRPAWAGVKRGLLRRTRRSCRSQDLRGGRGRRAARAVRARALRRRAGRRPRRRAHRGRGAGPARALRPRRGTRPRARRPTRR